MKSKTWLYGLCVLTLMIIMGCSFFQVTKPSGEPSSIAVEAVVPTEIPHPTSTATVQSTIPGWVKFEGRNIELWLPDSYTGGDLTQDLDLIVEKLRSLGSEYESMANLIEQNPDVFVIWAFDSVVGSSGSLTSVAITTEKVLSAISIDTYLDTALTQFPSSFVVTDRKIVKLNQHEAGRLEIEFTISGIKGKELLYAIKDGNKFWIITYGTSADEYDDRLGDFEQSARTFKVNN